MPAESHNILFRSSNLHYKRFGHGEEWLFCFHGYGEESSSFLMFEPLLGNRFTIIAIDFPFHGQTNWKEGLLFDPVDLISLINRIKPANESMHMLGYSMGGRVALQLATMIPKQIVRLVLVAPDGLHKNKWQWMATRTIAGNRLFGYIMKYPFLMRVVLNLAATFKFYNQSILKFVHYYLDDAEQRNILYRRWTTMRKFRPGMGLLKKQIIQNKIPSDLVFGKFDRVILTRHGHRFSQQAEDYIKVIEIEAGHQLLREKYALMIANLLLKDQ